MDGWMDGWSICNSNKQNKIEYTNRINKNRIDKQTISKANNLDWEECMQFILLPIHTYVAASPLVVDWSKRHKQPILCIYILELYAETKAITILQSLCNLHWNGSHRLQSSCWDWWIISHPPSKEMCVVFVVLVCKNKTKSPDLYPMAMWRGINLKTDWLLSGTLLVNALYHLYCF